MGNYMDGKLSGDGSNSAAVRELKDGRAGLPTPSADHIGEAWYDGNGSLYIIKESYSVVQPARGVWSQYTHANFDGEHGDEYHGTNGHYFYDIRNGLFYRIVLNPAGEYWDAFYSFTHVSPQTVLGSDAVWLTGFDNATEAVHAIDSHDSTKIYYAYFDDHVRVLDNSTYQAPVDRNVVYTWSRVGSEYHDLSVIETLWSGNLYRTNTGDDHVQSLNAGKHFSDYSLLSFEINGNEQYVIFTDEFEGRTLGFTTYNQRIWLRHLSDTTFDTTGGNGSGNVRLTKITGYKI